MDRFIVFYEAEFPLDVRIIKELNKYTTKHFGRADYVLVPIRENDLHNHREHSQRLMNADIIITIHTMIDFMEFVCLRKRVIKVAKSRFGYDYPIKEL